MSASNNAVRAARNARLATSARNRAATGGRTKTPVDLRMNQVPWAVEQNSANVRRVRLVAERGVNRVPTVARRPGQVLDGRLMNRAPVDSGASLQAADMRVVEAVAILEVVRRNVRVMANRVAARVNFLMVPAAARVSVRAASSIATNAAADSVAR